MSYTLLKADGTTLTTVQDNNSDSTSTSLTLIGKNFPGYGKFLNENFVRLLENFSQNTSPSNPTQGQLWWDKSNRLLKVYQTTGWKVISSSMSSASAPSDPVVGDLWWDTGNSQLKVYSGTTWVTIGPAFTPSQGTSGAVVDNIVDTLTVTHTVVKFYISNTLVAILNKDAEFTPSSAIAGFTTIKPGYNLSNAISGSQYWGDANNALNLGGYAASAYVRLSGTAPFTSAQSIQNNAGLAIGTAGNLKLDATTGQVNVTSVNNGDSLVFYTKVANNNTKVLELTGSDGAVLLTKDPVAALGAATKQFVDAANLYCRTQSINSNTALKGYVDAAISAASATTSSANVALKGYVDANMLRRDGASTVTGVLTPDTDNTRNLGAASTRFATVYGVTFNGVSTTAKYADLAERFAADKTYLPGTVVEIGGDKEVTQVNTELSDNVLGVISTNAAHLMNGDAGSDQTHPPIALSGRVPVRVIGPVSKGQRLVSAGNGAARAAKPNEVTPFNVIGRVLTNKSEMVEGLVESIVKISL